MNKEQKKAIKIAKKRKAWNDYRKKTNITKAELPRIFKREIKGFSVSFPKRRGTLTK